MEEEIIPPVCLPGFVIRDIAGCFTPPGLTTYMRNNGMKRCAFFAYTPMFNGRAERMVELSSAPSIGSNMVKAMVNGERSVRISPMYNEGRSLSLLYVVRGQAEIYFV